MTFALAEEVRERTTVDAVAAELHLQAGRRGSWAPCPVCEAEQRGRGDGRGPIGTTEQQGWRCHRCDAGGDTLDLACRVIGGGSWRELAGADRDAVRAWFAARGWATDDRPMPGSRTSDRQRGRGTATAGGSPTSGRGPSQEPRTRTYQRPPAGEVAELWDLAVHPADDPEVAAWLDGRELVRLRALEEASIVRALPPGAPCPVWAYFRGRPWSECGYRALLPLFDARGELVSIRARAVDPGCDPKGLAPIDFEVRGLVLACSAARAMLATGAPGPAVPMAVVEGGPDFLTAAVAWPMAVLGIGSGAWTDELAERVPDGSRVAVWTDPNEAGDKYAAKVARSLVGRCTVVRL